MAAAYEDIISIDSFAGINQSREDNTKLSYAVDGKNFFTTHGVLQCMRTPKIQTAVYNDGMLDFSKDIPVTGKMEPEIMGGHTLAFLHKRWKSGESGIIPSYGVWAVAVVCGRLYARQSYNDHLLDFEGSEWVEMLTESGEHFSFANDAFDTLTYELNYSPPVVLTDAILQEVESESKKYFVFDQEDYKYHKVESDGASASYVNDSGTSVSLALNSSKVRFAYESAPVDALLISNAVDGMYCIYAPHGEDTLSVARVPVAPGSGKEIRFGCIELHSERVWGSGILDEPDKMVYSAPNDVFNWEQNNKIPEDGAGDIQQPEWDGDRFVALKTFGSHLLAIKEHSLWRIIGMNPEEYVMKKQHGEGTAYPKTVITHNAYAYMLSDDGILVYDGSGTRKLKYGAIEEKIRYIRYEAEYPGVFGCMDGDEYCICLSEEFGCMTLKYNTIEGTFTVSHDFFEGECVQGYFDSWRGAMAAVTDGGKMYLLVDFHTENSVEIAEGEFASMFACITVPHGGDAARPMEWESAWQDMGAKNVSKSAFEIYLCIDALPSGIDQNIWPIPGPIPFIVGIITEKKSKVKNVMLTHGKPKRIRLNNSGRRFKLLLSTETEIPWALHGGVEVKLEYDYD